MQKNLYAIFDTASGVYDSPLTFTADAEAIRFFKHIVGKEDTVVGKNPEDFSLVRVAAWNDTSGEVVPFERETLMTGNEAVAALRNVANIQEVGHA